MTHYKKNKNTWQNSDLRPNFCGCLCHWYCHVTQYDCFNAWFKLHAQGNLCIIPLAAFTSCLLILQIQFKAFFSLNSYLLKKKNQSCVTLTKQCNKYSPKPIVNFSRPVWSEWKNSSKKQKTLARDSPSAVAKCRMSKRKSRIWACRRRTKARPTWAKRKRRRRNWWRSSATARGSWKFTPGKRKRCHGTWTPSAKKASARWDNPETVHVLRRVKKKKMHLTI